MNDLSKLNYLMDGICRSYNYKKEKVILYEAKELLKNSEEGICYFKNLFVEDKLPILFIFEKDKVIKISINDDKDYIISVDICNKSDLKNISYSKKYYNKEYQIYFKMNEDDITIAPNIDTNNHNADEYNVIAEQIIQYLKDI